MRCRVAAILLYLIFSENWGPKFFGIRQIRIQQPFPYLKIVYANFSAKMPTGLWNFVFPDLSICCDLSLDESFDDNTDSIVLSANKVGAGVSQFIHVIGALFT